MDEEELGSFIDRLNNVADEPKARKPRASKPYPIAVNPRPSTDNAARKEDWGGEDATPVKERAASPTSGENLAYLNAMTSIRVVFKDGREVVTTVEKVDDVIAEEKEARRSSPRERPPIQVEEDFMP